MNYIDKIAFLDAYAPVVLWLRKKNYSTLSEAWAECQRGDLMLWLAGRVSGKPGSKSRRLVARAAADCAELALPEYEAKYPGDDRPRKAIEAARRGEPRAAKAAGKAARDAGWEALQAAQKASVRTWAAAWAAMRAAEVAWEVTEALTAELAAEAVESAVRCRITCAQCADIARKHYKRPPRLEEKP